MCVCVDRVDYLVKYWHDISPKVNDILSWSSPYAGVSVSSPARGATCFQSFVHGRRGGGKWAKRIGPMLMMMSKITRLRKRSNVSWKKNFQNSLKIWAYRLGWNKLELVWKWIGGHSNGKRGYQARPWTHKKHPRVITYFSGMKIDHKYAFLYAFFLICLSCPFQNLSPKTYPFFQFSTFLQAKRCTCVHCLVLKNREP